MFVKSERYVIRKLANDDANSLYYNYKGRQELAKFVSSRPHSSVESTQAFITKCVLSYEQATPTLLAYAIACPNSNNAMGLLVFVFNETHAEIHFGLSDKHSGKGIASSVCEDALEWLKGQGIHDVRTQPHWQHKASIQVLSKCGFKNHGLLKRFAHYPQMGDELQNCLDMRFEHCKG